MEPDIDETPLPPLPFRPARSHKGVFGAVLIVAGSVEGDSVMLGAPAFAALGALRAGAGLARVLAPAALLPHVLALCPSATGIPVHQTIEGEETAASVEEFDRAAAHASSLVVGPGLGRSRTAGALTLRAVQQEDLPVVVDADAITILSELPELWRDFHASAVLTPHPGEFRRIGAAVGITDDPVDPAQRPRAAAALARRLGCIVVLKGAGTVVSDGLRAWVCERGHPCMATGGTGDVLAGMIGGLAAASGGASLYELSRVAVCAHALAGEAWAASRSASAGMLAGELAEQVPAALEGMRARV
ncbi:MAG: NAD(P)H-hydrate dehydratase [Phycisphaerales bacterium]